MGDGVIRVRRPLRDALDLCWARTQAEGFLADVAARPSVSRSLQTLAENAHAQIATVAWMLGERVDDPLGGTLDRAEDAALCSIRAADVVRTRGRSVDGAVSVAFADGVWATLEYVLVRADFPPILAPTGV